jgi:hypothetical protein
MYRLFASGVVLLWVSAMTALFVRDVWPAWSAQDAPPLNRKQLADLPQRQEQFGIFKAGGERIGTARSDLQATPERTTIRGTIAINALGIIPALRIESETEFDSAGGLDSFDLRVIGIASTRITVRGERRGIYFPVEMHFGTFHRQANLDMSATRLIGDSMRPFTFLPTLHVGQSWRMQLLDPIAAALSGKTQFRPIVARVTRQETIEHLGKTVDCFVVETSPQQVTAWVDAHGRVLVQEVDLPGFGRIQAREEPYDEDLRNPTKPEIQEPRGEEPTGEEP